MARKPLDNYERDLAYYDRYRRQHNSAIAWMVIGSIAAISVLAIVGSNHVMNNKTYDLQYKVEGVDESWLNSHPFDTSSLPQTRKGSETIALPENGVAISGYKFTGWYYNYATKPLKDNKLTSRVRSKNVLTAKYEIVTYRVELNAAGGTLSSNTFDGHTYAPMLSSKYLTTFVCLDRTFNLPTATKDSYTFNANGWKDSDGNYYLSIDPSTCMSYSLTAEWSI